jgi:predicted PurR-regulated permease PerM
VSLKKREPGSEGAERAARSATNVIRQTKTIPRSRVYRKERQRFNSATLAKNATALLPRIGRYTLGFFGALATVFFLFVVTLYILAQPKPLIKGFCPPFRPLSQGGRTRFNADRRAVEAWALATLLLMVIIGCICASVWRLLVYPTPTVRPHCGFG